MTRKGRDYEHELVNGIDEITPTEVWVTSCGYSGNSLSDACDIVLTLDPYLCTSHQDTQVNIEVKKRSGKSGNRVVVFEGGSPDETGLEELQRFVEATPDWADSILAIKFDHRKLVVLDAEWVLDELDECGEYYVPLAVEGILDTLLPRLTDSDNISMKKPLLAEWVSSKAARPDERVLAERLGLPVMEEDDGV